MVATDVDEGLTAHKGRYGKPAPLFAAWRQRSGTVAMP